MKTIIAGSRDLLDYNVVAETIRDRLPWKITHVVSGRARGADTLGEKWAEANEIPLSYYPANWDKYGKRAGYVRNLEMAQNAEALLAFWDGESPGTKMMIKLAKEHGLQVFVEKVYPPPPPMSKTYQGIVKRNHGPLAGDQDDQIVEDFVE